MSFQLANTVKMELEDNVYLSKLSRSCDACKLRKVKCDGVKPQCSNCSKNEKICNYSLMKKPGLNNGYGKSLNERLTQIDSSNVEIMDLVRELSSRVEALENQHSTKRRKPSIHTVSTMDTSNSDMSPVIGVPPLPNQHHHRASNLQAPPTAQSTSQSSSSTGNSQAHQPLALPLLLNPFVENTQQETINGLPTGDVLKKFFDLYFEFVNPIFPILHRDTTYNQLFNNPKEISHVAYSLVLVTLKYFQDETFLKNTERAQFYRKIKEKILLNCFDVSNLDKLTLMLLLAFESIGQCNNQETWSLVAIICSGAIHLDLIEEVAPQGVVDTPGSVNSSASNGVRSISTKSLKLLRKPKNFIEEEIRRRVFWCIYLLDRINAVISSTPLKIPDAIISCSLPADTSKWLLNEPLKELDAFGYSLQLIKLFGKTHEFNKSHADVLSSTDCQRWLNSFKQIEGDLREFVDSLPLKFSLLLINSDTSFLTTLSPFDVMLHTIYNITLIKLHSPLGYPHNESEYFKHSQKSRVICSNCCKNVLNMVSKVGDIDLLVSIGPIYAIFLWIVTRVMIVEQILDQKDLEITIKQNSRLNFKSGKLLEILDRIGNHWNIAKKYSKIIRFLSNMKIKLNNEIHGQDDEEEDSDDLVVKREPSSIISDMRLNTYFVSLVLSTQMEEQERVSEMESTEFNGLDTTGSLFQLDMNSYGFEDFFKYLGDMNDVQ